MSNETGNHINSMSSILVVCLGNLVLGGLDGSAFSAASVEAVAAVGHEVVTPSSLQGTVCPAGTDQSRQLVAAQPCDAACQTASHPAPSHDENVCSFIPVCSLVVSIFACGARCSCVSSVSIFHQRLLTSTSISLSCCLSSKGTWQRETVWLQRTSWWRSVTSGCPVSKTTVSTPQTGASDRSLSNGRLLKPWTTVGHNCPFPEVTDRNIPPGSLTPLWKHVRLVALSMLPPAGVFRPLYHRKWRLELWYSSVGDLFHGNDTLHYHDEPTDTRGGGER